MSFDKTIQKINEILIATPDDFQALNDLFEIAKLIEKEDFKKAHEINKTVRKLSVKQINSCCKRIDDYILLRKRSLLFDSQSEFDAYMQYVEFERDPDKKFYVPRSSILRPIVFDMQKLVDDVLDILGISLPPGTGKSTLGIFFLSWLMGKFPEKPNLASAHSDKLTRSFYDGVGTIITDPEYLWSDVFPNVPIIGFNAKDETIDLGKPSRFKSLTCRSIDGSLTGATRCEGLLYADDLVSGIEEAVSKDRLDKLWEKYANDLKSRKKLGCKELHIETRWSVHDPVGRLERQYTNDPRAKFISIPALNENDESNFNYKNGVGFDKTFFIDMRNSLDDVSWRCLYQNEPIEREGLLFPEEELKYYNGVLPGENPDRIISWNDVAWGGGDSLSQPFAYVFGNSVYIHDVVFNKGDKKVTRPIVCGKMKLHRPHETTFEANNGGHEYCDKVDEELTKEGIHLNISSKTASSKSSKLSRIIQYAPDIKTFYFRDKKHRDEDYREFMKELTSFLQTGKSPHDDSPDSLAGLASIINTSYGKVSVFDRPF